MKKRNRAWLWGSLVVAAFGLWHLLDVRAGAAESGDTWLIGQYIALMAAVIGCTVVLGRLFGADGISGGEENRDRPRIADGKKGGISLPHVYLAAGTMLGMLYLLVLPPLSAPDEISHYIGAYQLSSRLLGQPSNSADGHVLVRCQDIWLEDTEGEWEYEVTEDGYLQPVAETTADTPFLGEVLMEKTYKTIRQQGLTGRRYPEAAGEDEGLKQSLVLSPHPAVVTTPAAYIPQALGIALARLLSLNSVMIVYLGRLFNLAFFVGMTYLSMKRLPFGKEVLFGVALLPMTLHLSASLSYDVMILACMFYLTAVCLDLACEKEQVEAKDVVVLALLMAAAGPCKLIYGVLMGLCLLISPEKFGKRRFWILAAAAVGGAWVLSMAFINGQTIASYAAETESVVPWSQEPGYSLRLLLHQPLQGVRMFYQTLLWQAQHYHLTMIGAYMGNLDQVLDVPYGLVVMFTVCLLWLAMKKPGERQRLSGGNRIWIAVVCALCACAAMGSMLIAWTPLSSPVISGVQGRYFLPFLPVLLMAFKNDVIVLTKNGNRSILYLMCCANGYVLLRLYSIVSMRL